MTSLSALDFRSLLPSSIAQDSQILAAADVLSEQLEISTAAIPSVLIPSRIDELTEPLLSLLAWQYHVDHWEPDWDLEQKREAVKSSIRLHKRKGTPWAVKEALRVSGLGDAEVIERGPLLRKYSDAEGLRLDGTWRLDGTQRLSDFEKLTGSVYPPHWANFIVRVNMAQASRAGTLKMARAAVDAAKPVRSWPLWAVHLSLQSEPLKPGTTSADGLAGSVLAQSARLRLDGSWRLGRDAAPLRLDGRRFDGTWRLDEMQPPLVTERLQSRLQTLAHGSTTLRIPPGRPVLRREPAKRMGEHALRMDGSWQMGTNIRLDGAWRLDGRTCLHVGPRMGMHPDHRWDGTWRLGESKPICTTWPSVN